jgi:ATP-dependent DNA helicase RecQ
LNLKTSAAQIENTLFYLSKIGALKIEGGFLVLYNRLNIEKLETNNNIQYKKEDYKKFENFYSSKVEQIHIVGEYANKMLSNVEEATAYVEDYFHLNGSSFLNKYFPGSRRNEIRKNITPTKFKQLMGDLSDEQKQIVVDKESKNIVVLAGPGSGKTKVLVHKLASLLLVEDVKHEQLLMLTFSRTAVTEFKKRLRDLIGNAAYFLGINTFHSFCFDLLGQVGDLDKANKVIAVATEKINNGEVEQSKITKSVLVLDEAQDINKEEFQLIQALMAANPDMRVVAVGDDDQNIFEFRGADSNLFFGLIFNENSTRYELLQNSRSKPNLVEFSNQYIQKAKLRFKSNEIYSEQSENGEITVTKVSEQQLLPALVDAVLKTDLTGSTAILTNTNEDALQITGFLNRNNMPAQLIQNQNNTFNLTQLMELRTFYNDLDLLPDAQRIAKDKWNQAKILFAQKFKSSSNYHWCKNLLVDFQDNYPKIKFVSDFKGFLLQSKIEDFIQADKEQIIVSTIHKAKGHEFDNVFLGLHNFKTNSNDNERAIYVALTRAKTNLQILTNTDTFNQISVPSVQYVVPKDNYPLFDYMEVELGFKDVHLGYFGFVQKRMQNLLPGYALTIIGEALGNADKDKLVNFSAQMNERIHHYQSIGFELDSATVSQIIYWDWTHEDETKEIKIVLPKVVFKRSK